MSPGRSTEVFTLDKFLGYTSRSTGPPGTVVDLGEFHTPIRSRGFQIDNTGALVKSHGYCTVAQIFDNVDLTRHHGLHYWGRGDTGSTLVSTGAFGISRSRQISEDDTAEPFMTRFETLSAAGPTWPAAWSTKTPASGTVGVAGLYGCFAEFNDRLYYCNGMDWPIRIDNISELYRKGGSLTYQAMGVFHPNMSDDMTIGVAAYQGKRSDGSAVNRSSAGNYVVTMVKKYGESPAQSLGNPISSVSSSVEGVYTIISVDDWASDWTSDVLGINIYRVPRGSTTAQFVGSIRKGDASFIDTVPDDSLGYGIPTDSGLPSNFRLLCTHEERMFGVGGFGRPNRLACSKAGFPDVWPATFEINSDSGLGSNLVTQAKVISGELYFFLQSGILRLVGSSPTNYRLITASDFVGCIAPRTMFPWQDGVVFLSQDGLYNFNGSTLSKVTHELPGIIDSPGVGSTSWRFACGAVSHDYYYLSYRDDTGSKWQDANNNAREGLNSNRTFVINMNNGHIGVIDDWAFNLSTPYEGTESIVMGHDVLT